MDAQENEFNVDDYRRPHDSTTEWKLRRAFILSNKDQLEKDELITLASCYVNIHFYGCSYPEDLMQRLSHYENNVERSLITDFKPEIHNRATIVPKRKLDQGAWRPPPLRNDKVNMPDSSQLPFSPNELAQLERKFSNLSSLVRNLMTIKQTDNAISILQMAFDKKKMTSSMKFNDLPNRKFSYTLQVDCINLSEGEAPNKKQAKAEAYQNALSILNMPHLKIAKSHKNPTEYVLIGSANTCTPVEPKKPKAENDVKFDGIFVLIGQIDVQHSATNILRQSAEFNRLQLDFDVQYSIKDNTYDCRLSLGKNVVSIDKKDTREEATTTASETMLELLRKSCYTILSKSAGDVDINDAVQKEQLLSGKVSTTIEEPIPDSNIGNKLLRRMGWSGGGVGKEGNQGISSPIGLSSVRHREGLGMRSENGITPEFQVAVTQIVEDFIRSDKQEDLVFAPSFSVEERSTIHNVARKLHLKTKSYNKGDERYLILSRKRSPQELLAHLLASGGETRRHKLVPPTS